MKPKSQRAKLASLIFILFIFSAYSSMSNPLLIAKQLLADSDNLISGKIVNAETGSPIAHVEVFISGTTVGCITNELGMFQLKVPFVPCTMVANHVSYDAYIATITSSNQKINISLNPFVKNIEDVVVKAKDKRKRNLRFFYSHFIGNEIGAIKILNDSVLVFKTDDKEFIAYTNQPLFIENKNLGYRIKVILKKFSVIRVKEPNGPKIDLNSLVGDEIIKVAGGFYYEEIEPDSDKKLEKFKNNRQLQYFGSYRHFLKAIFDDELDAQGFIVNEFPEDEPLVGFHVVDEIIEDNQPKDYKTYLLGGESLEVYYYFDSKKYPVNVVDDPDIPASEEKSIIYPGKGVFKILKNGTSPNVNFTIKGPMGNFCIPPNSLPDDYVPPIAD